MKRDQNFILINKLNSGCMEQWRGVGSVYINNCAYFKSLVEFARSEMCTKISLALGTNFFSAVVV